MTYQLQFSYYHSPQNNINIFSFELSAIMTSGSIQTNCTWIGDINIDILEKNTFLFISENYLNILYQMIFLLKYVLILE